MTFLNFMEEFRSLEKRIRTIANCYDMRTLSETLPFPESDDTKADMELMIEITNQLEDMVAIKSTIPALEEPQRSIEFKNTVAQMALVQGGGFVYSHDVFKERFLQALDPARREVWMGESVQMMVTMIREQAEIAELLKSDGILIWLATDFDPHDQDIRLVNVNWLREEADIYSYVANAAEPGKRCRFCNALESPESLELQPLDPEQRNRDVMIAGMSGKRIAILQQGRVHCHVPCAPYWLEWVKIAERLEEAAA